MGGGSGAEAGSSPLEYLRGRVFSRMNGYAPERFVELLTGRIRDALGR
jgi:hypothetical protein